MKNSEAHKNSIYLMCDDTNGNVSKWELVDYKLRLSYKNPDEYSRRSFNIKEENTFYEIIFWFDTKERNVLPHRTIDIELDFAGKNFTLNDHWSADINSIKFTRKQDYVDFSKKLVELNIEVKKLFDYHYKKDSDKLYHSYLNDIDYEIKEKFCKGKKMKTFDITK